MNAIRLYIVVAIAMVFGSRMPADGCSRVVYVGDTTAANPAEVLRIVGRSLDWRTPIPTNLYVYPRGMEKKSSDSPGAITWTSRYSAIYAVGYDGGITEGMNEAGLVINGLFCKAAVYNNPSTADRPPMSLAMFVGWLLDLNATTAEVAEVVKAHDFRIGGATFDNGTVSALHWGVTDAAGHSAVIEFDNGDINVYEGYDLPVMTNDPALPAMKAIEGYWSQIGGANMLPGTVRSADRFVRGSYFQSHVMATNDADLGLAIIRSIMFNVSVPFHYEVAGEPNLSSTQWRSFANIRDRRYYFDMTTAMGIYYIDLKRCELSAGAPVMILDTSKALKTTGDATGSLKPHAPFLPMY